MISRAVLLLVWSSAAMAQEAPPATPPLPKVYFDFQVERPVMASPKNKAPQFPRELRAAGIEGEMIAAFVVDSTGRPIPSTFKVVKSSHDLFTKSVADALPELRFTPASIGGKKVAQLVQMPFVFSIAPRDTGDITAPAVAERRRAVTRHAHAARSSPAAMSLLKRRVTQMMIAAAMTNRPSASSRPLALKLPEAGFIDRRFELAT